MLKEKIPEMLDELEDLFGPRNPEFEDFKLLAHWQLAHECVHLIDPHKDPTNFLEEGLATWYQNQKAEGFENSKSYKRAENLVRPYYRYTATGDQTHTERRKSGDW